MEKTALVNELIFLTRQTGKTLLKICRRNGEQIFLETREALRRITEKILETERGMKKSKSSPPETRRGTGIYRGSTRMSADQEGRKPFTAEDAKDAEEKNRITTRDRLDYRCDGVPCPPFAVRKEKTLPQINADNTDQEKQNPPGRRGEEKSLPQICADERRSEKIENQNL